MSDKVHVFANGFEFDCWQERNCDGCSKEPTCDLIEAIFMDSPEDGQIFQATADRMGYSPELKFTLGWPCAERLPALAAATGGPTS